MGLLGEELRRLRRRARLTQEDVAKILRLARYTYSRYETGRIIPSKKILEALVPIYAKDETEAKKLLDHLLELRARDILAREQAASTIPGEIQVELPRHIQRKLNLLLAMLRKDLSTVASTVSEISYRLGVPEEDIYYILASSPENPPNAEPLKKVLDTLISHSPGVEIDQYKSLMKDIGPFLPHKSRRPPLIPAPVREKDHSRAVLNRRLESIIAKIEELRKLDDEDLKRVLKLLDAALDLVE